MLVALCGMQFVPVKFVNLFHLCAQALALMARFAALPGYTETVLVQKLPLIRKVRSV